MAIHEVDCLEPACWFRPCFRVGEDKGTYVPGRGYTSYHSKPRLVCLTRHLHGCPSPIPVPEPELARCCYRPAYPKGRSKVAMCATCGNEAPRHVAGALNRLPTLPGVPCRHVNVRKSLLVGWAECPDCGGHWDRPPLEVRPHDVPSKTLDEMLAELARRLDAAGRRNG